MSGVHSSGRKGRTELGNRGGKEGVAGERPGGRHFRDAWSPDREFRMREREQMSSKKAANIWWWDVGLGGQLEAAIPE